MWNDPFRFNFKNLNWFIHLVCGHAIFAVDDTFIAGPGNSAEKNQVGHWPWIASLGNFNDTNKIWTQLLWQDSVEIFLVYEHFILFRIILL